MAAKQLEIQERQSALRNTAQTDAHRHRRRSASMPKRQLQATRTTVRQSGFTRGQFPTSSAYEAEPKCFNAQMMSVGSQVPRANRFKRQNGRPRRATRPHGRERLKCCSIATPSQHRTSGRRQLPKLHELHTRREREAELPTTTTGHLWISSRRYDSVQVKDEIVSSPKMTTIKRR